MENEDNQKTLENDAINDALASEGNNNNKLGRQYTKIGNNNLEVDELHNNSKEDNNNENKINNDNNNIQTNTPKNDENKKTKESSKKKKKDNKKDRVKKIKLIEQKNLKLKKMIRLIILQNFINGFKIGLTLMLTITYFILQIIYSNQKKIIF